MSSDSRWAVVRGATSTWHRFRDDWHTLPSAAWKQWAGTLVVGFGIGCAVMYALSSLGARWAERGMQAWDREWLLRIERENWLAFDAAIWWEAFGGSALLIPLVVCAALLAVWLRRPLIALTALAAYILHDPIVLLGWRVWQRARPDLIAGGIAAPPLGSFPSGHVVQSLSIYGFFAFLWIRASSSWIERALAVLLVLAMTGIVGVARLRIGAHWPSDIFAAAVIGGVWLATLIVALRRGEAAMQPHE